MLKGNAIAVGLLLVASATVLFANPLAGDSEIYPANDGETEVQYIS